MAGIRSCGIHVPIWKLPQSLGLPVLRGEKAVAGSDEDSATMAVAAGLECLSGTQRKQVDGLLFSSTTPPCLEKQIATLIASALDSREDIFTLDTRRHGQNVLQ